MFHMADFAGSMAVTLRGGVNVMLKAFQPEQVLQTLGEESITHVLLVPAMIKMALDHPAAAKADISSLQCVVYGASPMPAATLERLMQLWPSVGLVQAYGQTELAPVATLLGREDHRPGSTRLSSAGQPTPVSEIRIVDEQGMDCSTGHSG
jgi:acyl-CoA synthetase (AMP-forming)/AMP-acid ligase II